MTIDGLLIFWLTCELDGSENACKKLRRSLEHEELTADLWDEFEAYHYDEIVKVVQNQVTAILKKHANLSG